MDNKSESLYAAERCGCVRTIPINLGEGASTRPDACHCGGAGVPCLACNPSDREHPPKMPERYKTIFDKDRRRH